MPGYSLNSCQTFPLYSMRINLMIGWNTKTQNTNTLIIWAFYKFLMIMLSIYCVVVQELTTLHEVVTKERAEHELVVKGLKQELLTTNNR